MNQPNTILMTENQRKSLDLMSRDILIQSGFDLNILDNYIYGKNAAFAIDFGASVQKAREIALEKTKNAVGYNSLLRKLYSVEGVNLSAYSEFVKKLNSNVCANSVSISELKETMRLIQVNHLKNVSKKTEQVLGLVCMGATFSDAANFVRVSLK